MSLHEESSSPPSFNDLRTRVHRKIYHVKVCALLDFKFNDRGELEDEEEEYEEDNNDEVMKMKKKNATTLPLEEMRGVGNKVEIDVKRKGKRVIREKEEEEKENPSKRRIQSPSPSDPLEEMKKFQKKMDRLIKPICEAVKKDMQNALERWRRTAFPKAKANPRNELTKNERDHLTTNFNVDQEYLDLMNEIRRNGLEEVASSAETEKLLVKMHGYATSWQEAGKRSLRKGSKCKNDAATLVVKALGWLLPKGSSAMKKIQKIEEKEKKEREKKEREKKERESHSSKE